MGWKDILDEYKEKRNIKKMFRKSKRPLNSTNYQITCSILRNVFYLADFLNDDFYNNVDFARKLLKTSISYCSSKGFVIPDSYKRIPITFISNESNTVYGYIFEFDDAKYECECNYIGMIVANGKKKYYTSEYYTNNNSFGLCMFKSDGSRVFALGTVHTFDDFADKIIKLG